MGAEFTALAHQELLAEVFGKFLAERADENVGAAAGSEGHDDADRFDRVRLRDRWTPRHQGACGDKEPACATRLLRQVASQ